MHYLRIAMSGCSLTYSFANLRLFPHIYDSYRPGSWKGKAGRVNNREREPNPSHPNIWNVSSLTLWKIDLQFLLKQSLIRSELILVLNSPLESWRCSRSLCHISGTVLNTGDIGMKEMYKFFSCMVHMTNDLQVQMWRVSHDHVNKEWAGQSGEECIEKPK